MANQWRCWVPVLKVDDARRSVAFYRDVLGFRLDWEHRFDDGFPLYVSLSRDALTLHLSEHGDETAPATLVVSVEDVDAAWSELSARGLESEGPPEDRPYGVRDFALSDPDGHRLVFATALPGFEESPGRVVNQDDT